VSNVIRGEPVGEAWVVVNPTGANRELGANARGTDSRDANTFFSQFPIQ
jgi:hypothetical protein